MRSSWVGLVLGCALSLGACGADDGGPGSGGDDRGGLPAEARAQDFPKAPASLGELAEGRTEGPVLAPAVSVLEPGTNRFGFALFSVDRKQLADAQVAVYVGDRRGGKARGPFPAKPESLAVDTRFRSRSTAADPDAAKLVYVAQLPFDAPGDATVAAVVRRGGEETVVPAQTVKVAEKGSAAIPVGAKAPRISTPTAESVGGDLERIDTRVPPSDLHDDDFKDVVGKKPVLLLFATPALCASRTCGPVVDVAEQVRATDGLGERVSFIQMEIYNDNQIEKGFRPQVGAFKLPTEPWAFAIDASGKVAARLEGPFSARELEAAVRAAL